MPVCHRTSTGDPCRELELAARTEHRDQHLEQVDERCEHRPEGYDDVLDLRRIGARLAGESVEYRARVVRVALRQVLPLCVHVDAGNPFQDLCGFGVAVDASGAVDVVRRHAPQREVREVGERGCRPGGDHPGELPLAHQSVRDRQVAQDPRDVARRDPRDELDVRFVGEQRTRLRMIEGRPDPDVVAVIGQSSGDVDELHQVTADGAHEKRGHQRRVIPAIRWVFTLRLRAEKSDISLVTNHKASELNTSRARRPSRSSPVASADCGRLMNDAGTKFGWALFVAAAAAAAGRRRVAFFLCGCALARTFAWCAFLTACPTIVWPVCFFALCYAVLCVVAALNLAAPLVVVPGGAGCDSGGFGAPTTGRGVKGGEVTTGLGLCCTGTGTSARGAGVKVIATTTDGTGGVFENGIVVVGTPGTVVVVVVVTGSERAALTELSRPAQPDMPVGIALIVNPGSTTETVPVFDRVANRAGSVGVGQDLERADRAIGHPPGHRPELLDVADQERGTGLGVEAAGEVADRLRPNRRGRCDRRRRCGRELVVEEGSGAAVVVESAGGGRLIVTLTGSKSRLDFGILISPFLPIVAAAAPVVDIPATVNVGVYTERSSEIRSAPGIGDDGARTRRDQRSDNRDSEREGSTNRKSTLPCLLPPHRSVLHAQERVGRTGYDR